MPTPTAAAIGSLLMQRSWIYEFNIGTTGSPVWAECEGVTNTQFTPSAGVWTDSTDQSGAGKTSEVKTGDTFAGNLTVNEGSDPNNPIAHAPVQDFLRTAGEARGSANVVQFRVSEYDFNDPTGVASPRVYAYTGRAGIDYAPASADVNAKRTAVITLHPDSSGPLARVSHPYPGTPVVPTLSSFGVNPMAAAGGTPFRVTGYAFTGTTGVTIGGVAATQVKVVNDDEIIGIAPAHAAGSGLPVVVTNATGPSAAANLATFV